MKTTLKKLDCISAILIIMLIAGRYTISADAESINGRDSKQVDETILNSTEDVEIDISEKNFFNFYDIVESPGYYEDNVFYPKLSLSYILKPEIANRLDEKGSDVEITIEGKYEFAPVTSIVWDEGKMIIGAWSDDKYINSIYEINSIMDAEKADRDSSPKLSETVSGKKEIIVPLNKYANGIWIIKNAGTVRGPLSSVEPSDYVEGATWFACLRDLQITSVSGTLRIGPFPRQDDRSDYIDKILAQSLLADQEKTQITVTTETDTNSGLFTNGQVLKQPDYECVAPFEINAGNGCNYYVYLKYVKEPLTTSVTRRLNSGAESPYENDIAFYVESGKKVEIEVPIGVYKLYYASGKDFYGTEILFGEDTQYAVSDQDVSFYADDEYIHGCSITLYNVVGGNLSTENISEDEFPK